MKKPAAFLCAAVAFLAGVAFTPAFFASATDIVLTPEQTRALFSDRLTATYFDGATYQTAYFTFFDYGIIDSRSYQPDRDYDCVGDACVIYKLDNVNIVDFVGEFALRVNPIFDISGLDFFRMSCGVSYAFGVDDVYPGRGIYFDTSSNITNSYWSYYSDYRNSDTEPAIVKNYFNYYSTYGSSYGYAVKVKPTNYDGLIDCSLYQTSIYNNDNKYFTVYADTASETGILQRARVEQNVSVYSDVDDAYFVYLTCPDLTSGYTAADPPNWESSGGGSESSGGGYDGPDYSEQLALILAKLDLIVNNDFNIDVDLSADLAGLESRLDGVNSSLDGVNSRLDGNNSRLDGVTGRLDGANSRLDGVNSRLDGVNSRLDNISAELHDLNSAPTQSLPDTGGENSEFEHQADMYMQDFKNEYEDSENQVFEVIDKGTGFLGFVRDILITSHLAQILPLLALLFIAHYVIFERGG